MECLENLIGIKGGCGTPTTPSSGLWLNSLLPGVTIKAANAAVNSEQISGYDLIEEKMALADVFLVNDIRNYLAQHILLHSVVESDVIGKYEDDLPLLASESGYYKGVQIKIDEYAYLSLYISTIRLQLTTAVTTDILIIDLITGKTLDTLPITTVADEITEIVVNKSYKATRQKLNLLIVYDAGVSNARRTGVYTGSTPAGCSNCRGGWYQNYAYYRGVSISTAATKTNTNVNSATTTSGMSVTYSLNCDEEPFICSISNRLALPKAYKTGELLMEEMIHSDRLNHIILTKRTSHKELKAEFYNEYFSRLSSMLENMPMPNDICFRCNPSIRKVVQAP